MAHMSGNRKQSGKQSQQRRKAQSGQNGGQDIYRQNQINQQTRYTQQQYQQYGVPNQATPTEPQQLASNMPQQTFVQRGTQQQTRKNGLTAAQKRERAERKKEKLRRTRRNRRLIAAILVLVCIVVGYNVIRYLNGAEEAIEEESLDVLDLAEGADEEEAAYTGPPVATISFLGDISVSADQVDAVTKRDGNYDFSTVFADVEQHLAETDYAVANFETTMVEGLNYGGEPYYNAPVQLAGALNSLGIRLVSTANTYMLNNGIDGLTSTKRYLAQAGISSVGTYTSQEERDTDGGAYIKTIHKIKFAFLSYTKGTDSVTMPDGCEYAMNTLYTDYSNYWTDLRKSQIKADVQAARAAGAEVIIMLVHWGSEYSRTVSQPQKELAELLFSYGVDVIVGTHSHVVNAMEFQEVELSDGTKKTCFVAYGLGDFYSDPEQESGQISMILNLTFSRDDEGVVSISDAGYIPLYQNIVEANGIRSFALVDVYDSIAEIYRSEDVTYSEATLYNALLDAVDSLHTYAGEDYDAGPADEDFRVVRQALEEGEYSVSELRELQDAEEAAAKEAAAMTETNETVDTEETENTEE